ncbi:hypothetical protein N2152v2_000647 [Parachlorella kessleri]
MEYDRSYAYYWPHGGYFHIWFTQALCEAAAKGDAARIRALFAEYEPEGPMQKEWRLPLVLACRSGCRAAVQALLECGIRVDSINFDRRTALLIAAREGLLDGISSLLAAGADINARDCKGHSALRLAAFGGHHQVVEALLAAGCNINSHCNAKGATALHIAASKGDTAIMEALVAAGADCGAVDIEGRSPLAWAARYENTKAVQRLLELGAPVDASALTAAAVTANTRPLKELLTATGADAPNLPGVDAALRAAASRGQLFSVKALLSAGLPADAQDSQGRTALLCAADSKPYASLECVKVLLAAGASVDKRDGQGRTALMCVSKSRAARTAEIIQILLAAGASVDARDKQGQTAIMYAAQGDSADAIRALAAAGASINARDNRGRTALHGFARHGQRVAAFKALLGAGADTSATDTEGVTVLLAAIKAANAEAASLIIGVGADGNAADRCGNTPAFLAAVKGMRSVEQELRALGAQGAPSGALRRFFRAADRGDGMVVARMANLDPPAGVDINAVGGAGAHCTHLLAAHISERRHSARELEAITVSSLLAAGADLVAASRTNPTPLDLMLFEHDLDWLQWNGNASAIVKLIRELAAAGCPVDTRLPARCGNPGLRPSTLETWLARLSEHGWPAKPADMRRALQVSRALLSSAAAQGSQGRPELLAAAEAEACQEEQQEAQFCGLYQPPPGRQAPTCQQCYPAHLTAGEGQRKQQGGPGPLFQRCSKGES